mmetsp:Transcript_9363/g.10869  ORF Transcript_9363/g.10869 Transcript_9363/m.10869 type:complete len:367 (+) Transcript_9363:120-1220(+)
MSSSAQASDKQEVSESPSKRQRLVSSIVNLFTTQDSEKRVDRDKTESGEEKAGKRNANEVTKTDEDSKDISKCPFFNSGLKNVNLKPKWANISGEDAKPNDTKSSVEKPEQNNHVKPKSKIKNMVLTGGSRGIGHATVQRFSSSGWRVITLSRQPFPERGECPWIHGKDDHVQVDLADPKKVEVAIETIREKLKATGGTLDALVNNAAISPKDAKGNRIGLLETDMHIWHKTFQVNFFAPIMLARGLYGELKKAKGSVVNVTSIVGTRVHPFAGSAYATTKAALAALTREMASDFGKDGVRVNAISPGEIDTSILSPGTEKIVENDIPMRRLGTTDEVAKAIYFLCTDASSYVSGTELHINGAQHV